MLTLKLFGGALEISKLPSIDLLDVSQMRQVPDNQEVFVDKHSDLSIIVELLEHDPSMTIEKHFAQLAEDNGAKESEIVTASRSCLYGTQTASKFNKQESSIVHIYLGLLTLNQHKTDVLVSLNSPKEQKVSFKEFTEMFTSLTVKDASIFVNDQ